MNIRRPIALIALLSLAVLPAGAHHEDDQPFTQVLAPGYTASPYAVGAAPATTMAFGPDGNLYVATLGGQILRYIDVAGVVAGPPQVVATGIDSPLGMNFGPDGLLYVAATDTTKTDDNRPWGHVLRMDIVSALAPQTVADAERLLIDIPNGIHNLSAVNIHPNGDVYVGVASATLDGYRQETDTTDEVELLTLSILRFDPDDAAAGPLSALKHLNSGVSDPDPVDTVATGIHNTHDIAFRGDDIFTGSNGPQSQEPYGEDYLVRVIDAPGASFAGGTGQDFGTPRCLWKHDEMGWPEKAASTYPLSPAPSCDGVDDIALALGLHRGSTGVAVADEGFGRAAHDVFVAEWGNLPVGEPAVRGHKVVRVGLNEDGSVRALPSGMPDTEDFLVTTAPIDIAFKDGVMYVADFGSGVVFRVAPEPV